MSDAHDIERATPKGRAILISYNELLVIRTTLVRLETMFNTVLALKGQVDDHEMRLVALEQIQAAHLAVSSTWKAIRAFVFGLLSALIGGGALTYFLPKIWGG